MSCRARASWRGAAGASRFGGRLGGGPICPRACPLPKDRTLKVGAWREEVPGAVVLAARRGRVAFRRAYGSRAILPQREPMTEDTIFDAASLTKVVATATSIMILVERGQVRLSDPISRFIPEIRSEDK